MKLPIQVIISMWLCGLPALAQDVIQLENASFETEMAEASGQPASWRSVGTAEAPPRRHTGSAMPDGSGCMVLLTHADGTCQALGIHLGAKSLLRRDSAYRLALSLMQARHNENDLVCNGPVVLRVWGHHSRLNRRELLAESAPVDNAAWMSYEFTFSPAEDSYDELFLEAAFDPRKSTPYNSNLLIDNILPLTKLKDPVEIKRLHRPEKFEALLKAEPEPEAKPEPDIPPVLTPTSMPVVNGINGNRKEMLNNPSFEDVTKMAEAPSGWYDCGFPQESPPDVQPGSFNVKTEPKHGSTYLGMVVRDNESWEGVAQRLSPPLIPGNTYLLKAFLSRSDTYMSISQTTKEPANYTTPAVLRVWAGNSYCDKRELLFQTAEIRHKQWLEYQMTLTPKIDSYEFIELEVYYVTPLYTPYNGNILIDHCTLKKANK